MRIKDYLAEASGDDFGMLIAENTQVWSNIACKGYAKQAMKYAGLDTDTINDVLMELKYCFDTYTVDEAEDL